MEMIAAVTIQSESFNYPLFGSLMQGSPRQHWGMFSPTLLPSFPYFPPVICKLWAVNPARGRQGQWSLFHLPRCVGGMALGLLPDCSDSTS